MAERKHTMCHGGSEKERVIRGGHCVNESNFSGLYSNSGSRSLEVQMGVCMQRLTAGAKSSHSSRCARSSEAPSALDCSPLSQSSDHSHAKHDNITSNKELMFRFTNSTLFLEFVPLCPRSCVPTYIGDIREYLVTCLSCV